MMRFAAACGGRLEYDRGQNLKSKILSHPHKLQQLPAIGVTHIDPFKPAPQPSRQLVDIDLGGYSSFGNPDPLTCLIAAGNYQVLPESLREMLITLQRVVQQIDIERRYPELSLERMAPVGL